MASLFVGTVQSIVKGEHGSYIVIKSADIEGSVTCSVEKAWKEETLPESGTVVVMQDILKKRSGWRAMYCRFFRPEDEGR